MMPVALETDPATLGAIVVTQARLLTLARAIDVPDRIVLEIPYADLRDTAMKVPQWEASKDQHGHPLATSTLVHYLLALAYVDAVSHPRVTDHDQRDNNP